MRCVMRLVIERMVRRAEFRGQRCCGDGIFCKLEIKAHSFFKTKAHSLFEALGKQDWLCHQKRRKHCLLRRKPMTQSARCWLGCLWLRTRRSRGCAMSGKFWKCALAG